jgi:hypothetical protein
VSLNGEVAWLPGVERHCAATPTDDGEAYFEDTCGARFAFT